MLHVRQYGSRGPCVAVLHGGPGAPGYMAPVARGLADAFRVIEPFQRGSGGEALTVARHVEDLREVICQYAAGSTAALIGSSWGAMLALAYAASHPTTTGPVVLVGCGTFDPLARASFRETIQRRTDDALRRRMEKILILTQDEDQRLKARADALLPLYSYDPITADLESEGVDSKAHHQTWEDMLRLQASGVYPAAFAAIKVPVLMVHGSADPHPGSLIRASLERWLPQLEYRELDRCGHYPWIEKAVAADFFKLVREWLLRRAL